ncbi:MAG: NAD-binding protein, partial [Boseongicola sp.]|nr:NAD-binding protein [Boseongicola sp.]
LGLCLETGTDIDQFFDIVTGGTGFAYSRYFENRVPRMRDGEFGALFMLKFMLKDARLARGMSDKDAGTFPLLEAAISTLEEGDEGGYGDDDFSAAMKVIQDRLNLQL